MITEIHTTERDRIEAAKKDPKAFEPLYTENYPMVFRFLFKRITDTDSAHDIASEVFYKAMMKLPDYQDRGVPFSAWLIRIAINELNKYFRNNTNQRVISVDSEILEATVADINDSDNSDKENMMSRMIEAINDLPDEMLYLFELKYFEQYKIKEIAEMMGITEGNVKVKLHRIKNSLKTQLA